MCNSSANNDSSDSNPKHGDGGDDGGGGRPLHLFEGVGIEIEYMIVDRLSLDVRPIAETLLVDAGGEQQSEIERGAIAWSNELVMHLIEMKTNGPAASVQGLAPLFQASVRAANRMLQSAGARLLPGAMHPWMDPTTQTRIWPHEQTEVYRAYDAIFGVRGHGWANLQSMHINLPFCGDEELARLHSAVRVVLPLLPALAASSPFFEGRHGGVLDQRLMFYRDNQKRVPSIGGAVIPEVIRSESEYRERILAPMFRGIAPSDPHGILQHEWLNSRGAVVRFDRHAVEIRLLDSQESPLADLAVADLVTRTVRALAEERWAPLAQLDAIPTAALADVLDRCIKGASQARIALRELAACFGVSSGGDLATGALWQHVAHALGGDDEPVWQTLLRHGTLAERLLAAAGGVVVPERESLRRIYAQLADALAAGRLFGGEDTRQSLPPKRAAPAAAAAAGR